MPLVPNQIALSGRQDHHLIRQLKFGIPKKRKICTAIKSISGPLESCSGSCIVELMYVRPPLTWKPEKSEIVSATSFPTLPRILASPDGSLIRQKPFFSSLFLFLSLDNAFLPFFDSLGNHISETKTSLKTGNPILNKQEKPSNITSKKEPKPSDDMLKIHSQTVHLCRPCC